jgi:hypothetical protein
MVRSVGCGNMAQGTVAADLTSGQELGTRHPTSGWSKQFVSSGSHMHTSKIHILAWYMSRNYIFMQWPADSSALWSHLNGWVISHKHGHVHVDVRGVYIIPVKVVFRTQVLVNDVQTLTTLMFLSSLCISLMSSCEHALKIPWNGNELRLWHYILHNIQ